MRELISAVLLVLASTGCTHVEITHEYGDLPEIEIETLDNFCTAGHDVDLDGGLDEITITCKFEFTI